MRWTTLVAGCWLGLAGMAQAGEVAVSVTERPDLKAVFGQVESRDLVPARARIGGTITALAVEEGSAVKAGDVIATVVDDKLALQLSATDARIKALEAERDNAKVELDRAVKLLASGVVPKTRVDQLQTLYDVLTNQIAAAKADRSVLQQQQSEGNVLAPAPGRVLSVPVTRGSVIMPGETVARIAGGGYFLRLSLPERHAARIKEGDEVLVGSRGVTELADPAQAGRGHVVKVYPEIDVGRVLAGCRSRRPRRLLRGRAHAGVDSRGDTQGGLGSGLRCYHAIGCRLRPRRRHRRSGHHRRPLRGEWRDFHRDPLGAG